MDMEYLYHYDLDGKGILSGTIKSFCSCYLCDLSPKPVKVLGITAICLITDNTSRTTICHQTSTTLSDPAVLATLTLAGLKARGSIEIGLIGAAGQDLCSGMTTLAPLEGVCLQAGVVPFRRRQVPTTV